MLGTSCSYESKGLKRGPPKGFRSGPKESAKARLLRSLETTIRDLTLQMGTQGTGMEIMRISQDRGIALLADGKERSSSAKRLKGSFSEPSTKEEPDEDDEEEDFLGINDQGSVRHFGSSSGIQLLHQQPPPTHTLHRPSRLREDSAQRRQRSSNGSPAPYPLPTVSNRLHGLGGSTSHSNSPLQSPDQQLAGTAQRMNLVSPEMNRRLFHHYWEGFHPFWPVLYKPAFDELSVNHLPALLDVALCNAIHAIAVCVASPLLDADVESELGDSPAGDVLFHRAESHLFSGNTTPTPSLSSIQTCFFLALYCQGSGQLSKAYVYSSLANSMSFDLGLHRHLHHYDNNPVEKESRVRLIHCVYILSTILSAEMGRPAMMRSKDIDVPLLSEQERDESQTDQAGNQLCIASCLNAGVRLFSIVETLLTQVHSFRRKAALRRMGSESTRKVVEEVGQQLETWRKTLPKALKLTSDRSKDSRPLPNFVAVHLWYHTAVLLLHRPFIPHEEGSSLHELLNDPCHIKCTRASNDLFHLLTQLSKTNNVDRLSTDLAYCIFTAAVMFVFNARLAQSATSNEEGLPLNSSTIKVIELSKEARRQFLMCKEWLRSLSARWPAASAHKQLLDGFSTVGDDVVGESGDKADWTSGSVATSTWGVSSERELTRSRRGALDASHEHVGAMPQIDTGSGNYSTPASNISRFSASSGSYSDGSNGGPAPGYHQDGSQFMYYPTSTSNQTPSQAQQQQELTYRFPPNIFDMESVYWNETVARNPTTAEAGLGLNATQQARPSASYGSSAEQVKQATAAMAPSSTIHFPHIVSHTPNSTSTSLDPEAQNTTGLQMLAQATTAGIQQVSPFSFHQEPSQPEWNDVINMLQLPPAFLQ